MTMLTATEQRNLLSEGFEDCPDCNGVGMIDEPRGCLAAYRCGMCDGEGIVYSGEEDA